MKENRSIEQLHRGHTKAKSNLVTAGFALLLSSALLMIFLSLIMRNELIDDGKVQAKMLAANSNAVLLFADEKAGQEILSSLAASPSVLHASINSASGDALAQYRKSDDSPTTQLSQELKKSGYEFSASYVDFAQEIRNNEEVIGWVVLRYGLTLFYNRLIGYMALIMVVAFGALLIVHFFLSGMRVTVSKAELHLEFLAHTDPVTSMPNRRAFNVKLVEALTLAREEDLEVGLMLMDLDNFKVVNDTLGHQCGDEILRMVAQRLTTAARSTDTVCRIGGDEFVIIMQQSDNLAPDLEGIAKRVMHILSQPFRVQEQEFFITASIGGSLYPRDARDSQTLIRTADTAMYSAKLDGKNTFAIFQVEMDERAQRRLMLEKNLRKALGSKELSLHYQPQVALKSGRIIGVEALLRWDSPEMGTLSPTEFIPVAEESGLIVELGKWVLQTACQQMVEWRQSGVPPMRVAVNLSTRQFKDQTLMSTISAILSKTGLSPLLLELEITEGILMDNVSANVKLLQNIQQAGINIAIDDFGTGYSSLSYLKRFPINLLKIDRSFVSDLPGQGEAFVTAIIAMAHSLGLVVVAEGIETAEQLDFLKNAGCDIAQGYYFSQPMPVEQVVELLRDGYIHR